MVKEAPHHWSNRTTLYRLSAKLKSTERA